MLHTPLLPADGGTEWINQWAFPPGAVIVLSRKGLAGKRLTQHPIEEKPKCAEEAANSPTALLGMTSQQVGPPGALLCGVLRSQGGSKGGMRTDSLSSSLLHCTASPDPPEAAVGEFLLHRAVPFPPLPTVAFTANANTLIWMGPCQHF